MLVSVSVSREINVFAATITTTLVLVWGFIIYGCIFGLTCLRLLHEVANSCMRRSTNSSRHDNCDWQSYCRVLHWLMLARICGNYQVIGYLALRFMFAFPWRVRDHGSDSSKERKHEPQGQTENHRMGSTKLSTDITQMQRKETGADLEAKVPWSGRG